MANNFADALEADIINHFLKTTAAVAQPTNLYLCLFTADPTEAGATTNEVPTGVGYTRQVIAFAAPSTNGTAKRTSNTGALTFGPATGAGFGTVAFFAIVDAAAATAQSAVTKWLFTGPLTASKTVAAGDSFVVAIGALTIDID